MVEPYTRFANTDRATARPSNMLAISLLLAITMQDRSSDIEAAIKTFGYVLESGKATESGRELAFFRMSPKYEGGAQGGYSAGPGRGKTVAKPPPPIPRVRDDVRFLVATQPLAKPPNWPELKNIHFQRAAFLGRNGAHFYYGYAPIPTLIAVQKSVGATGGEDWRKLAVEGLLADDRNGYTANACTQLFKDADDSAIPYLLEALKSGSPWSYRVIEAIGMIRTPGATSTLIQIYWAAQPEVHQTAALALAKDASEDVVKAVLLDAMSKGKLVPTFAGIAAKRGWTEALPAIRAAIAKPEVVSDLIVMLESERSLSGNPVPAEIAEALRGILSGNSGIKANSMQVLAAHPDKEIVAAYGVRLLYNHSKGNVSSRVRVGEELLARLPKNVVDSVIARLKFKF
jgi:hypothetical protein